MDFLYIKALHLIFVVSWFAGLFYIVRLFIYHTEAEEKPAAEREVLQKQFIIMERRLWTIITWPAAILSTFFGYYMVYTLDLWSSGWMMVKLGLTTALLGYHIMNHILYKRLQRNLVTWTSTQLRLWNELAAMFLVTIIFVVVLKNSLDWIYGTLGFFALGITLMIAIRIYKRFREK
mgnify:CR=1 FL=1|jgi:putative membrane protein